MNTPAFVGGTVLVLIGVASYLIIDFPSCQGKDICGSHTPLPFYLAAIGLILVGASFVFRHHFNAPKPHVPTFVASLLMTWLR